MLLELTRFSKTRPVSFWPLISTRVPGRRTSRIEPGAAETVAREATRTGQVVGVRFAEVGYAPGEAPLEFAEPFEERTVEYDQEALRHFEEDS
jgi:hypothetical protein